MADQNNENSPKDNSISDIAKSSAKREIAKRALRGAKPAPGGVAGQALKGLKQAGSKAAGGDMAGAAEDTAIVGSAAATATAFNPLAGAVVGTVLNTKSGKKFIKLAAAGIAFLLLTIVLLFNTVISAASNLMNITASSISVGVSGSNGGGFPITDPQQKAEATIIMKKAFDLGYGNDGALAGIVAALAASNLDNIEPSAIGPLTPVGVFGFAPYEWAPQFWRGVSSGGEGWDDPERLRNSIDFLMNTENSANLFYKAFETNPQLRKDSWEILPAWDTARFARESRNGKYPDLEDQVVVPTVPIGDDEAQGDDEITIFGGSKPNSYSTVVYSAQAPRAISSMLTLFFENPMWKAEYGEIIADLQFNNSNSSIFYGIGTYTLAPPGERTFTDGGIKYKNTDRALARANSYVGNAILACPDGMCYRKCDHLAGDIWGYADASGYATAKVHWFKALKQNVARPGNRNPPIGSLLFWDSGHYGHVATYVGNGLVVSNLTNGPNGSNVYLLPAEYFEENWGSPYLGWADPIFFGQKPGTALR
jgi:hypothetical protein